VRATLLSSLALVPLCLSTALWSSSKDDSGSACAVVVIAQLYFAIKPSLTLITTMRAKNEVEASAASERRRQRLEFELKHAFKASSEELMDFASVIKVKCDRDPV